MPRLTTSIPKYRKHKASGQAIVTLDGRDFYLGPHGTKTSRSEYDRIVGEWQANGRHLPAQGESSIAVVELCARYWTFAKTYYVKNGKPTDELACIRAASKPLRAKYGKTLAADFGPLSLEVVRQEMVKTGNSRRYINKNISRIRRIFKWGVSKELLPAAVYQCLRAVDGLKKGKTAARELAPVLPVSDAVVDATATHCKSLIADMIMLQQATGCRPGGELFSMRPRDVDRSGEIWLFRPESHKTEHTGRDSVIPIGPRAQSS